MPHAFARAWAARDAGALAALFAEDADFVNVVGLWWHDRAAIEKAHAYGLSTFFRNSVLKPGRVKLRMLGPDAAVVQCRFTLTGQIAPDGSEAGARRTVLSFVMQRREDGWICVSAQNTDIVPGAETHLATDVGLEPKDYR
ncbi:MAG: SgcJ/EcaC family oxidoreductase [Rhodobacteraceae bacterium]|nr:SgcJ/EcaC family oxidoreductase [Paracoccaceae bacterium]